MRTPKSTGPFRHRIATLAFALLLLTPLGLPLLPRGGAQSQSQNVAFVGSDQVINGGGLFHADPAFGVFAFADVDPSSITDASSLAAYDTVVLNVASPALSCSTGGLSQAAKAALVSFVHGGGKMLIYDSECTFGGAVDYNWLPFPFTTNNPGAQGANGVLQVVEENSLSCSSSAQACYIDVTAVGQQTDAVGDSNVVLTQDSHWCGDLRSTNVNGFTGYSHMYAIDGPGLYIYNGLDQDAQSQTVSGASGSDHLSKVWYLELLQPWGPPGLPCSAPVQCNGAPLVIRVDLTKPATGFDYFNDNAVAQTGPSPVSRVVGSLTVTATTTDTAQTARVEFSVDGTLRAIDTSAPFTYVWDADLEPTPQGFHQLKAQAFPTTAGACAPIAIKTVFVVSVTMAGRAIGLFAGNTVPATLNLQVLGATLPSGTAAASDARTVVDHVVGAPADARVQVLRDTTQSTVTGAVYSVTTTSTASDVSLLGGLVRAQTLRSVAGAVFDRAALAGSTSAAGTMFADLLVAGTPVQQPVAPNTVLTLPGGLGWLVLNEQLPSSGLGHVELTVNAVHLYLRTATTRDEVIVAQAMAGADLLRGTFTGPSRTIESEDDAATGGDAGDSFATATPLALAGAAGQGAASVGGRLGPGDPRDFYGFPAAQGQNVKAVLLPAARATETVDQVRLNGFTPSIGASTTSAAAPPFYVLRLREPVTGAVRGTSALAVANIGLPERVELNVDKPGNWVVELERVYGEGNYTLAVTVTPIALLPDDQVLGPDAPSTCATAATPLAEAVAGVLKDNDFADVWTVQAGIGDVLTAALKPGEDHDGADFDLFLYAPDCTPLASSTLGKEPLPKGLPDLVLHAPVAGSGTYKVEVRRINGAGNYELELRASRPLPTVPNNDALTGADAGDACASATPLPLPGQGAFEGAFPDGDAADHYSVTVGAGQRLVTTAVPSPTNDVTLRVYGPGCALLGTSAAGASVPEVVALTTPLAAGTYVVGVERVLGGGNYLFSVTLA